MDQDADQSTGLQDLADLRKDAVHGSVRFVVAVRRMVHAVRRLAQGKRLPDIPAVRRLEYTSRWVEAIWLPPYAVATSASAARGSPLVLGVDPDECALLCGGDDTTRYLAVAVEVFEGWPEEEWPDRLVDLWCPGAHVGYSADGMALRLHKTAEPGDPVYRSDADATPLGHVVHVSGGIATIRFTHTPAQDQDAEEVARRAAAKYFANQQGVMWQAIFDPRTKPKGDPGPEGEGGP